MVASQKKGLLGSTMIYLAGSFGSRILTFVLLPVYASCLSREQYGSYDLVSTVIQIIYPAVTFMLDNAMYVYLIGSQDAGRRDDIISFAVRFLLRNCVIAVAAGVFIGCFYRVRYMGWIVAWLVSQSVYSMWAQILRGFGKTKAYSVTGVLVTAVTLAGNITGLLVLGLDYDSLMISNAAAYTVAVVFMEFHTHALRHAVNGRADAAVKRELLKYTIPLLPNQLSWWIIHVSDRLMIAWYWGSGYNGIYAMACKIPTVLITLHQVFNMAWSDIILSSGDIRETERYAGRVYNKYIRMMIGVTVILIGGNRIIFTYVVAGNFVDAYRYTFFLYLANIFNALASCLGTFFGYFKKSVNVGVSTIMAAALNFGINAVFMDRYGIRVAALSTFAGFVVMWVVRLIGLRGMVDIRIDRGNKLLFLLFVPLYFADRIDGLYNNLLLCAAGCLVALIINMGNIRELLDKFRHVLAGR